MNSISIALCTYNGEKFIAEQLISIFNQSRLPDEIIIVDDFSIDATVAILESLVQDCSIKVKLIRNNKNLGVVKSFNIAINNCHSNFIALCDQDDLWHRDKLYELSTVLEKHEAKHEKPIPLLVYSDLDLIDEKGAMIGKTFYEHSHLHKAESPTYKTLATMNVSAGCSIMFNTALKEIALPFNDSVVMHDWWLALMASISGETIYSDKVLVSYRQHSNNVKGSTDNYAAYLKKLFSPIIMLFAQKTNYRGSIKQFLNIIDILEKASISIPKELMLYKYYLKSTRFRRILPLFKGYIHRQGLLRKITYFIGYSLNIFTSFKSTNDIFQK
jgi:glycosyltransferase involved in cell wall biosynthesis